jgi:hypothetical protein
VYRIARFIELPPSSPIPGAEDPDHVGSVGEANRQDAVANPAHTVEPIFCGAVRRILKYETPLVRKRILGNPEGDAVLELILSIL